MDLRSWLVADLVEARDRLAHGVLARIPEDRLRELADGGGIAPLYVLWHCVRHHDVAVNGVLRGAPEVLDDWGDRVGVTDRTWRGLAEGADFEVIDEIDPGAIGAYALATLDRTIAWLEREADLDDVERVPESIRVLQAMHVPADDFGWLYSMWSDKPVRWFLSWPMLGHVTTHTGELVSIRNRMGLSPF